MSLNLRRSTSFFWSSPAVRSCSKAKTTRLAFRECSIERRYAVSMRDKVENVLSHVDDDVPNVSATESTFRTDGVPLQMTGSRNTDNVVASGMWLATCSFAMANSALFIKTLPSFASGKSLSYDENVSLAGSAACEDSMYVLLTSSMNRRRISKITESKHSYIQTFHFCLELIRVRTILIVTLADCLGNNRVVITRIYLSPSGHGYRRFVGQRSG